MRSPFVVRQSRIAFILLSVLSGIGIESVQADDDPASALATSNNSQGKPITFEGWIREISPFAIRFHGGYVLPTNDSTAYFRMTEQGERRIEREELDQLIEEVDDDPHRFALTMGNDPIVETPSFKLGGRVRCEYVAGQSATKVVVLPVADEMRRKRRTYVIVKHAFEMPPEEESIDILQRRVSLKARAMPLKDALAELARSTRVPLELDSVALAQANVDLNSPITIEIVNLPIEKALMHLFDWESSKGVHRQNRGEKWFVTTSDANAERLKLVLPDWLQPRNNRVSVPHVDDDNQVISLRIALASDDIFNQLKTLPNLRELDIHGTKGVSSSAFAALAELDSVERLSIVSDGRPDDGDEIAKQIGGMKSLRVLNLSESGITDQGMCSLSNLPLIELTLSHEGRLTDRAIAEIAKLRNLKTLRLTNHVSTVKLGPMRFTAEALGQLSALVELERLDLVGQSAPKRLAAFPKLTMLELDGPVASNMRAIEFLGDQAALDIVEASHLKYLRILGNQITARGWRKIGTLPELCGISLPADITDSEIESLKAGGLPKLTQMQLAANSVTPTGIGNLAEFKSLNRLHLSNLNVPLDALQQLKALPNLRSLRLYGLPEKADYRSLKQLTQLEELYLERAPITQIDYHRLEMSLPATRIYAGHGTRWLWSIRDQK